MNKNELINQLGKYGSLVFLYCEEMPIYNELLRFFKDRAFGFAGAENMVLAAAGFALRGKIPVIVAGAKILEEAHLQIKEMIAQPNLNVKFLCDKPALELECYEDLENLLGEFGPGVLLRV